MNFIVNIMLKIVISMKKIEYPPPHPPYIEHGCKFLVKSVFKVWLMMRESDHWET